MGLSVWKNKGSAKRFRLLGHQRVHFPPRYVFRGCWLCFSPKCWMSLVEACWMAALGSFEDLCWEPGEGELGSLLALYRGRVSRESALLGFLLGKWGQVEDSKANFEFGIKARSYQLRPNSNNCVESNHWTWRPGGKPDYRSIKSCLSQRL